MKVENWKEMKGYQFLELDEETQNRVITEVYKELFFEDTKKWSIGMVNVMEEYGINNYGTGNNRIEIALGMLNASITCLLQAFVNQNRRELQCYSEDTSFAANLSTNIYDLIDQIHQDVGSLITLQTMYSAALKHRREGKRHLLDPEGLTKPFTEEQLELNRKAKEENQRLWREGLVQQRQELEDAYWGRRPAPELEENWETAQMVMPLWSVGFRPEEENEESPHR